MEVYERELEDYLEGRPEALGMEQWIGRQVPLAHGIADLIGFANSTIYVVELKAVPLEEEHVGQVLRYMYDVRDVVYQMAVEVFYGEHGNPLSLIYKDLDREYGRPFTRHMAKLLMYDYDPFYITPVLVGPESSEKIFAALKAINGEVWTWRRRGRGFSFEGTDAITRDRIRFQHAPEWVKAMWRVMVEDAKEKAIIQLEEKGLEI